MIHQQNKMFRAAKWSLGLCVLTLFAAPAAHAYFDILPPIRVVVPPVVGGVVVVDTPVVAPPVVAPPVVSPPVVVPPGGGTPPAVHGTPEPATLLLGLSAVGIAGIVARRRK